MKLQAPLLESRSADEIVSVVAQRAGVALDGSDPSGEALLHVFGRFFEILSERLNRVPEKHRLGFLQALGTHRIAPTVARVPLSFVPVRQLASAQAADGQPFRAIVPMHTRVAAKEPGPNGDAIVFETERPLELTSLVIRKVVAVDATTDRVADHAGLAAGAPSAVELFSDGMRPVRHAFCIARPVGLPATLTSLTIQFDGDGHAPGAPPRGTADWVFGVDATDAGQEVRAVPDVDTTACVTRGGRITFDRLPPWAPGKVAGIEGQWLRCRLLPASDGRGVEGPPTAAAIRRVSMSGALAIDGQLLKSATFNAQPLDLSTGFFPLGSVPRFGDAFYLQHPMFASGDARIVVRVMLAGASPVPAPSRAGAGKTGSQVVWETPADGRWVPLDCDDTTRGLTQSGRISFVVPSGVKTIVVNGVDGGWLRARYVGGYRSGDDASEALLVDAGPTAASQPSSPIVFPPAIDQICIDVSTSFKPVPVTLLVTESDFETAVVALPTATPFDPFVRSLFGRSGLYLGLEGPAGSIEGRTVDLYTIVGDPPVPVLSDGVEHRTEVLSGCEVRDADAWIPATLADGTGGFTGSGAISMRFEPRHRSTHPAAPALYWIRLSWPAGRPAAGAPIERILLNTVVAVNAVTVRNELLGSSNQRASQVFRCLRAPVLDDVELDVREALPSPQQRPTDDRYVAGAGREGLAGRADLETWVRWTQVPDFNLSERDDRHFVVDALSGTVSFGDGMRGRIPPAGADNVRMRRYRPGGGASGNVAAGSISELRTTVPYVTAVINLVRAAGGSDAEDADRCVARGSAWLRHRNRAVTREDFENLATSMPDIARARCLPLRSLSLDPDGSRIHAGWVSVVVVPRASDDAPRPTMSQLKATRALLDARRLPGISVALAGPEYVSIDVVAELACAAGEDVQAIADRCRARLREYLHPLTGGDTGTGWRFAQRPVPLLLNALLRRVDGVDQVRRLTIRPREQRPGLLKGDHWLICSGEHRVDATNASPLREETTP